MKLSSAILFLTLHYAPSRVIAQQCAGVSGPFVLSDITGPCTYETLLAEFTRQVFDAAGSTCSAGSTLTAQEDLDTKLTTAVGGAATGEEAAMILCKAMYDNADLTPFTKAADKGTDFHFEQMFYNGRSDWQEEVETVYETDDRSATSNLKTDAAKVREFYLGEGQYSRVQWPNMLTNFDDATCSASHAAMCCWPKDRQANDGNGNCATPYDENCVNKDPADNTNLCNADLAKGNASSGFGSDRGFMVFPEDNNNGEGAIHCHGFAWADDEYDSISRYKANNLFFVSMYDHMYQRGYVKNIPGMPMCGCMDQMPVASRSDCTQVDLTEDWSVTYDGTTMTAHLDKVEVDFNACRGRGGRNNDLWAYAARLYDEGRMSRHRFGAVGRTLTDTDCYEADEYIKAQKGFIVGYTHDASMYTKVAGKDDLKTAEPIGREAFNKAFFEQSLTKDTTPIIYRICPSCVSTHRKIWYRRLTPIENDSFDLLHHLMYYRNENPHPDNVWGEDFSLHSSYEDAASGDNPWKCPNGAFNYQAPFVGNCSPDGTAVHDQYSIFNWWPGPRPNVAYYINKPESTGVQDYVDNSQVTRAAGLTDIDIGNPGRVGNTMEDNGVFHVTGSGNDIWGHSDQFHYKSQPWEGDIDVKVHLTDFSNIAGNGWAKTGLMLRSDNSADATYAFIMLAGNQGINVQHRRSKGMHSSNSGTRYLTDPYQTQSWLRIIKKMETIEYYRSDTGADGDWILHATDTIFFPEDQYRVGFAVCSHDNSWLSEATFEEYSIETYNFPTSAPSLSLAPTPWDPHQDVGEPFRAGEFSDDGSIQYVKGSGLGIWGKSDQFFFYDEQLPTGDVSLEMLINRFDNWAINSRGGLMIRDSNDPGAANVFVGAAGYDQGVVFQSRAATGSETVHHKMIYVNNVNKFYVKLDKVGDVVTAYYKVDSADAWIELGSAMFGSTGSVMLVGRAVTAGSDYQYALETMETVGYVVTA